MRTKSTRGREVVEMKKAGEDDSALCNMDVFHLFFTLPPLCLPYLTSVLPHPCSPQTGQKKPLPFFCFFQSLTKKRKKESWNKNLTLFRLNSLLDLRENETGNLFVVQENHSPYCKNAFVLLYIYICSCLQLVSFINAKHEHPAWRVIFTLHNCIFMC